MADEPVRIAIAILYQDNQFLMQLRDNNPAILYPGVWAFFGGHVEPGESPEGGVLRELVEEIGYRPPELHLFRTYADDRATRYVFHGPLTVPLEELELNEGWDLSLVSVADIQRGECYSARAGESRPLGVPHRRMLLEFLEIHPLSVGLGEAPSPLG